MATRVATNVTIASIMVVRPSAWNWIGTFRPVIVSHSIGRGVSWVWPTEKTNAIETRNARPIPATTGRCDLSLSHLPPTAATSPPKRGRNGTSQALRTRASISALLPKSGRSKVGDPAKKFSSKF